MTENNYKQTHTAYREDYSESAALQDLLRAADHAITESSERLEADLCDIGSFTINIDGKSIAFICGGPQIEALFTFIKQIADENLYAVDFDKMTVAG